MNVAENQQNQDLFIIEPGMSVSKNQVNVKNRE